jgi:hypothetical protein
MLVDTLVFEICSPPLSHVQSHNPHVMDFMDNSIEESNGNTSNYDTSNNSSFMEAVSHSFDSVDDLQ